VGLVLSAELCAAFDRVRKEILMLYFAQALNVCCRSFFFLGCWGKGQCGLGG